MKSVPAILFAFIIYTILFVFSEQCLEPLGYIQCIGVYSYLPLHVSLVVFMHSLSFRGFVYCRNEELEAGWVVYSNSYLLHRPASFDTKSHQLCQVIDPYTLQVSRICMQNLFYLLNIFIRTHICAYACILLCY